jgi:hypothetical protein
VLCLASLVFRRGRRFLKCNVVAGLMFVSTTAYCTTAYCRWWCDGIHRTTKPPRNNRPCDGTPSHTLRRRSSYTGRSTRVSRTLHNNDPSKWHVPRSRKCRNSSLGAGYGDYTADNGNRCSSCSRRRTRSPTCIRTGRHRPGRNGRTHGGDNRRRRRNL